ncbi:hypothetical protein [Kribbella sp. NPDC048915]|uniref:hypothetical protein n=1 Tax=Kribbella sp. NPDC048915 TaxID=3155148 RepID=UPI0033F63B4D
MNPRPPWQNPRRRRQVAAGAGLLLLGYTVLFFVALLGGPRIGAGFLPLPGGGPDPAAPTAGPQPGEPTQSVAVLPPRTSASTPVVSPGATPSALVTPLPTATTPGETRVPVGLTTPYPKTASGTPTPQIVETIGPTIPVPTKVPPTRPTSGPTDPTTGPTDPTTRPTDPTTKPTSPPSTTTPTEPPTTPDDPDEPDQPDDPEHPGLLGSLLGHLLDTLGL